MQDKNKEDQELFSSIKDKLLNFDPVAFAEKNLTIDGVSFNLKDSGYKPFADIYRYIGIKAIEKEGGKPVILTKGRQVGGTVMACVLEMYFLGSGIFGNGINPPIRIMHTFPLAEQAAGFSKTKFTQMMSTSKLLEEGSVRSKTKPKTIMQSLLDTSSPTNDSLTFKQFVGGNHIFIDSIGATGDRIRGRQLCLETDLPTPTGFIKLKDLKEGNQLFDENGEICTVTKLHPINNSPEAYRITFDDGTIVDACAEHLWITQTKKDRIKNQKGQVKNTKEIFETIKIGKENNHSIPCTKPIKYQEKLLDLDPYLFGLWLGDGDGSGRIETADPIILQKYSHKLIPSSVGSKSNFGTSKSCSYRVNNLTTQLSKLGVLKNTNKKFNQIYNKFIPEEYMTGSFEQRLALLQGLMDSDGCCYKDGRCEFTQVRKDLANQVYDLILSLGIKARIFKKESWRYDVRYQDKYCIVFKTELPVFKLERKLNNLSKNTSRTTNRFICKIEKIDTKPMRCITVDSPSHLFLITKNYIPTHNTADVFFFDEVQDTTGEAISNGTKVLTTAKYGSPGNGVQVYFGTPKKHGSDFHRMWEKSSQQYYYLGCENCKKHFPLYTPGSDEWEKIWLYGFIVQCTHCGHQQDKREAANRGKWFSSRSEEDCLFIGFHLNQLYMPYLTKEKILGQKPNINPLSTERMYQNEVLGEFYQGDSSPITLEEIREKCGDHDRKVRARITPGEEPMVLFGIDYGGKSDIEQLAGTAPKTAGQSYSTGVILTVKGPKLFYVENAIKFKRNDFESKKSIIHQMMKQYSVNLTVGDIGYSNDISEVMQRECGDKYLVSRSQGKVNGNTKYREDASPKEIVFAKDHYYQEVLDLLKNGNIRFPLASGQHIDWLLHHCTNLEIKPVISRFGDPSIHYVKSGINDGFTALVNAYIAYKFLITKGFTDLNPNTQSIGVNKSKEKYNIMAGHIKRKF